MSDDHTTDMTKPDVGLTEPNVGLTEPDVGLTEPDVGLTKPDADLTEPDVGLTEPEPVSEPNVGLTKPVTEPEAVSGRLTEIAPEPVAEAEPEPVRVAASEPETEAATEPVTEGATEPEPVTEAATEPVTEPATKPEPEPEPEPATAGATEPATAGATEPEPVTEAATAPEAVTEPVTTPEPEAAPTPPPAPNPVPTPAMFARRHGTPDRTSAYGRVADDGVVYVTAPDGERAVGSYPGASPAGALAYFGRKYDELVAAADLLHQRVMQTDISAKDADEGLARLREQTTEPNAVGDLTALETRVAEIEAVVETRRAADAASRAAARKEGRARREALVTEAETIAAQPESSIQWKSSGARMRELLDEWKVHQRSGPRLDRGAESALWQRFSAARNGFDRARRVHFAQLDTEQSSAKVAKERLVDEAERLSVSKDWAPTAGAFKKLMDQWRTAGRAGRSDDDALWARFKAAQDAFFAAKDAVVAKEEESFRGNLEVKERLLREAEGILPVKDLERAKASLRSVQDRWDKAGKVPRADLERTEKAIRRVEQAVRDAEERRWSSANPEAAARAQSLAHQLEGAVVGLRAGLAKAEASGDSRKVAQAREALEAREQWLAQAKAGLAEFG